MNKYGILQLFKNVFIGSERCNHEYIVFMGKRIDTDKRQKIDIYKCSNCSKEFKLITGGY